jgi:hypothetical protein
MTKKRKSVEEILEICAREFVEHGINSDMAQLTELCGFPRGSGTLHNRIKAHIDHEGPRFEGLRNLQCIQQVTGLLLAEGWRIVNAQVTRAKDRYKGEREPSLKVRLLADEILFVYRNRSDPRTWYPFMFLVIYFRDPLGIDRGTDLAALNSELVEIGGPGQARRVKPFAFREAIFGALFELIYFHYLAGRLGLPIDYDDKNDVLDAVQRVAHGLCGPAPPA